MTESGASPDPAEAAAGTAAPNDVRTANFFVRHWRGEYSLARSYWINGILAQVSTFLVVVALAAVLTNLHINEGWVLYWCAAWAAIATVTVWQFVGVWRSASRHVLETGRTFWPRAAQVMVVLGACRVLIEFVNTGVPAIQSGIAQARWLSKNANWQFRLVKDGTEMEVSGGIGFGFADDLRRFLDTAPSVRLMHLNLAMGGLVNEAKKAGALIRSRGLSSYTSATCTSACTLIFLGGKSRFIRRGAKLGFHSPQWPGYSRSEMQQELREEEGYLTSLGVAAWFAAKAMATSATEMWYPTEHELLAGGVVTEVTDGDDFALSGFGARVSIESLDKALQTTRLFRALKRSHPDAYGELLQAELNAYDNGRSMEQLREVTLPLIAPVVSASLPYSSDEALLRFGRLAVRQLDVLLQHADACVAYLNGDGANAMSAVRYFPVDLRQEEIETQADVLETVDRSRRPASEAAYESRLNLAILKAQQAVGQDVWLTGRLDDAAVPSSRRCRGAWGLYTAIMTLPPKDAALVLRHMMAK